MARKTRVRLPALRRLEQRGVEHELVEFDSAVRSASDVAAALGVDPRRVLKTLVVLGEGGSPALVMLPSARTLDLKTLATRHGVKKLRMATHAEAERLTGLQVGGISALALIDRRWPVYLDEAAAGFASVLVSAGARGFDVRIGTSDLVRLTSANVVPLSGEPA